jgi:hypothetical protein
MSTSEAAPTDQTFYSQHQEKLSRLFEIVLLPGGELPKDLSAAVAATQPWVRGDHARPEHSFNFKEPESTELYSIYWSLGLRRAHKLPDGHYDHTIVLGGVHRGNNRRLEFMGRILARGDVITDGITLLGGERRIYPEIEFETIDKNLHELAKSKDRWLARLRATQTSSWWETDLLRLAALVHLGPLAPVGEDNMALDSVNRPHLQTFTLNDIPLAIMHTKAVERQGQARHTTEASMCDWLATAQPAQNSRVAFISANPHLMRMGRSAQAVLREEGRADIDLIVAGPGSPDYVGHSHHLGEIARHLYEDKRLLKT